MKRSYGGNSVGSIVVVFLVVTSEESRGDLGMLPLSMLPLKSHLPESSELLLPVFFQGDDKDQWRLPGYLSRFNWPTQVGLDSYE